ncbi:hypothetical protein FDECE_15957 [Fusarium decemcellulare]|nr:hypothetical protein FDECE_15957 [Fusarium decemcellulare]
MIPDIGARSNTNGHVIFDSRFLLFRSRLVSSFSASTMGDQIHSNVCTVCHHFQDPPSEIRAHDIGRGAKRNCKYCILLKLALAKYHEDFHHYWISLELPRSDGTFQMVAGQSEKAASYNIELYTIGGLPTRVIDVGSSPEETRLYVTKGEPVRYAALSHCWGGSHPTVTTRDTIEDFQKHLPLTSESQTFIDAIEVARALGIDYLWIDSLCIIQGDTADWDTEAPKMADIYANATVTLSADCAPDSSAGLFNNDVARAEAHPSSEIQCINPDDNSPVTILSRMRTCYSSNILPHTCETFNPPSKLSTRGWALQEQVLSKRIIHFYKEEVVWSCATHQRCECRFSESYQKETGFDFITSIKPSSEELLEWWPFEIFKFTKRKLTYSTDRLAAVSGLAALMHKEVGGKYLCGHWERSMEDSLLWSSDHGRHNPTPVHRIHTTPYAPSWSWASVDGPIELHSGGYLIEMKFIQGTTQPSGANPYGQVSMGQLTLRGKVVPLTLNVKGRRGLSTLTAQHSGIKASWWVRLVMFDDADESLDSEMRESSFVLLHAGLDKDGNDIFTDQDFLG